MEVVTFYSYKGGVGRTLLLAWVARALAARGKRVLSLDLDLEAPGLPTKLRPESEPRPGFGVVDLLLRFQGGTSPPSDLAQWCLPVATEQGRLWLLPAGAAPSPSYWHALSRISWETLFVERAADGARFFLWLRDALAKAVDADFLLIDARTGVTEMGAAAVGMLADTVVAVTNTSEESKTGLREVLRAAVGSPRIEGRPPLRILPVLSRVPALLGADDDARLIDQLQRFLNEEADPLTSTLAVERVVAIHHEEVLLEDERRAFLGRRLRVIADYERVLAWLLREPIPGGDVDLNLPRSSQLAEAVRAQEEVIAAYRESAAVDPTTYRRMLADALASLVGNFAQLGRREDALAAAKEMVGLYRGLAQYRPEIHLATLANGLRDLGLIQGELGMRAEALQTMQESVGMYRELAKQQPDVFLPDLARMLNNVGFAQRDLGRRGEALRAMREAVELYRRLAEQQPDAFLSSLADALSSLGDMQSTQGKVEEALRPMQDAVDIYRGLAEQRPDAFLPDLALSLGALGSLYGVAERPADALGSFAEGLRHILPMAAQLPQEFGGMVVNLAHSLRQAAEQANLPVPEDLLPALAELPTDTE